MAQIIDGKKISMELRQEIAQDVRRMKEEGTTPGLAVISVGEDSLRFMYAIRDVPARRSAFIPKLFGCRSKPARRSSFLRLQS